MNIQPIVEGFGEVQAVPVLLRRLRDEAGAFTVDVSKPIRKKRHELVSKIFCERQCDWHSCSRNAAPYWSSSTAMTIVQANWPRNSFAGRSKRLKKSPRGHYGHARIRGMVSWPASNRSAANEGCATDAVSHPNPEALAGPKERLEHLMVEGGRYIETSDQAALSAAMDMRPVYRRCRSFRHLVTAFGQFASAGLPCERMAAHDMEGGRMKDEG